MEQNLKPGEIVIYHSKDRYKLAEIKNIDGDFARIYTHSGFTAIRVPLQCIHKIENALSFYSGRKEYEKYYEKVSQVHKE